jgi:hypothetical protein
MIRNSSLYYMYIRGRSNKYDCVTNQYMELENMVQILLQLKCFLDVTIVFDCNCKHFYTNICTQSSENQLFPLPEKEDSEQ